MSQHITIRLLQNVRLPVTVDGGKHIWSICRDYGGKGGSYCSIYAYPIDEPDQIVTLAHGRENFAAELPWHGILVKRGTLACQILSKLVREGKAEFVPSPHDNTLNEFGR